MVSRSLSGAAFPILSCMMAGQGSSANWLLLEDLFLSELLDALDFRNDSRRVSRDESADAQGSRAIAGFPRAPKSRPATG